MVTQKFIVGQPSVLVMVEESSQHGHSMDLRTRTSMNYNESDELVAASSFFPELVHTTSSTTSTISMTSSSPIASPAVTTLVSATNVSSASDFVAVRTSSFSSLSLTDLRRQVQIARDELERKKLLTELHDLVATSVTYEVPRTTSFTPGAVSWTTARIEPAFTAPFSRCEVPMPSSRVEPPILSEPHHETPLAPESHVSRALPISSIDLAALRADHTLAKEVDKQIKDLGVVPRRRDRSSSSSSSDSSRSSFSDSSSSSEDKRKSKKKSKKRSSRRKKKSGKFLKPSSKVISEQDWPQAFLSLKYVTKAKKFEQLSLAEFVAGYSAILEQPSLRSSERKARIEHLRQLMYLATTHKWSSVLEFHACILTEIERGHLKWSDSFDSLLSHFLASQGASSQNHQRSSNSGAKSGSSSSTFFCRNFNNGTCNKGQSHTDMVNGKLVTVQHICSECYITHRTSEHHSKSSPGCPSRSQSSVTFPTPVTSS